MSLISFALPFQDSTNRQRVVPAISPTASSFPQGCQASPNIKKLHKSAKVKSRRAGADQAQAQTQSKSSSALHARLPLTVKTAGATHARIGSPLSKSPPTCRISFENVIVSSAAASSSSSAAPRQDHAMSQCQSDASSMSNSVPFPGGSDTSDIDMSPLLFPVPSVSPGRPSRPKRRSTSEGSSQRHGHGFASNTAGSRRRRTSGNLASSSVRHNPSSPVAHHSLLSPRARAIATMPRRRLPADVRFAALLRTAVMQGVVVPTSPPKTSSLRSPDLRESSSSDGEWEDMSAHSSDSDSGSVSDQGDKDTDEVDEIALQDMVLVNRLGQYLTDRGFDHLRSRGPSPSLGLSIPRLESTIASPSFSPSVGRSTTAPSEPVPSTSQLVAMLIMKNRDRAGARSRYGKEAVVAEQSFVGRKRSPLAAESASPTC